MNKKEKLLEKLQKRWANYIKADYEVQALFSANPKIEDFNKIDQNEFVKLEKHAVRHLEN